MKLSFKKVHIEADVEGLVSKKMDITAKERNGKTRYQIRQEEKRKTRELKHKQEMHKIFLFVGLFVVLLALVITMAVLESNGII